MADETTKPEGVTSKSEARRIASLQAAEKDEDVVVATPKAEDEDVVVVKKADLQGFLARLEGLEADNKRLIAVADKGRLAQQRERQLAEDGAPLIHTVKLTRMQPGGPIVVAWKLIRNESFVDGNRMVENQAIQVVFQDGTTQEMRLVDFYRNQDKKTIAEIIKRSTNEKSGETEVEVEMRDGERLIIPIAYVN